MLFVYDHSDTDSCSKLCTLVPRENIQVSLSASNLGMLSETDVRVALDVSQLSKFI